VLLTYHLECFIKVFKYYFNLKNNLKIGTRNNRVLARYRGEGRLLSVFNPQSQRPSICPGYEMPPNLLTHRPSLHYTPLTTQFMVNYRSKYFQ